MATRTIAPPENQRESAVGQVVIDFEVENLVDVYASPPPGETRRAELHAVLMDTGATHLCLPADVVAELGLPFSHEVPVMTPTGIHQSRIFAQARVSYADRRWDGECIELPVGAKPLLGALPMEGLGIEPDLQTRTVRMLPLGLDGTYFSA
jgi:predicted aspartyl protease